MTDSAPASWSQQFGDGLAALQTAPLRTPFFAMQYKTLPRLDRAEATEQYLGEWVLALIGRVEQLEAEVARLAK